MRPMTRREALAVLMAMPLAAKLAARPPVAAARRVFLGSAGLLLELDGTMKTWLPGPRNDGRAPDYLGLGHNDPAEPYTLLPIPNLANVMTACAADVASYAVLADGRVMSWGWNSGFGVLGTTPLEDVERTASWGPNSNVPVETSTRLDAVAVSSRAEHVLALARDGGVYAWGRGINGELGIGPLPVIKFRTHTPAAMTYVPFPVRIPDLGDVTAIAAGRRVSMALLKDGTLRTWGGAEGGLLGDGSTTDRDRPAQVPGIRDAVAIGAAGSFLMAVLADGTVMRWGRTDGDSGSLAVTPRPVAVPGVRGIRVVAGGVSHAAGITTSGEVMTWGTNQYYQLGRGGRNIPLPPGRVANVSGAVSIAAAGATTIVVLSSGRIVTWGTVRPSSPGKDAASAPIPLQLEGLDQS